MALNRLSHNLFASVVNFLSLNDFLALSCVCRKFYKTIQSDVRLFLREYLKTFFPKELNYF